MGHLIETEAGFAIQVPDLAIITHAKSLGSARAVAKEAIAINLDCYRDAGMPVPEPKDITTHLKNPDFEDLLFAYVEVLA